MSDQQPVRNLIEMQRTAALRKLDREVAELAAESYMVEVDRMLDRRLELMRT